MLTRIPYNLTRTAYRIKIYILLLTFMNLLLIDVWNAAHDPRGFLSSHRRANSIQICYGKNHIDSYIKFIVLYSERLAMWSIDSFEGYFGSLNAVSLSYGKQDDSSTLLEFISQFCWLPLWLLYENFTVVGIFRSFNMIFMHFHRFCSTDLSTFTIFNLICPPNNRDTTV